MLTVGLYNEMIMRYNEAPDCLRTKSYSLKKRQTDCVMPFIHTLKSIPQLLIDALQKMNERNNAFVERKKTFID